MSKPTLLLSPTAQDAPAPAATTSEIDLPQDAPVPAGTGRKSRTPVDPEILALWDDYKATGQQALRDRLLAHYTPLVRFVAARVGVRLPPTIEHGDLVSYGTFGLIDAVEKFQPERGLKFETYAMSRIRGAIIDELRSIDWVPRSVRVKMRDVDRAFVALEADLGRAPQHHEIAERIGISVTDLREVYAQASMTNVGALDDLMHRGGDGDDAAITLGERIVDHRVEQPGEALEQAESTKALHEAIADLNERDKILISLYYFENLTLAEIGQVLGVTESRVCQLHAKATATLRTSLGDSFAIA